MMAFSYDPSTSIGRVRLLTTDREEDAAIFSDEEIGAFLILNDDDVRLAAAEALESVAVNEALVLKKLTTLDLSTDGPALAKSLLDLAARLRKSVEQQVAIDYAEMAVNDFSVDELLYKQMQRGLF
jgi:hypothetical protein